MHLMWCVSCFLLFDQQEKITKTEADRDIMLEEKVQMDRDIEKWEAEFQKKNNREPNEDEK